MIVSDKKIVKVAYELYVDGAKQGGEEELMERATEQHPLDFCFGVGMMLPMFEANLAGKEIGEKFDFRIKHNEAYGEYDDESVLTLDRSLFEVEGELDEERVFPGNIVPLETTDGQRIQAQIVEVNSDHVVVDLNHPLAGENLHFVGQVLEVREATPHELEMYVGGGCHCGCHGDCESGCDSGCGGGCC